MPNASRSSQLGAAVWICALAFLILFGYAVARPATESLFLKAHGAEALPGVWVTVAIAVVLVVSVYNAAAARVGLTAVLVGMFTLSAITLIALLALERAHPSGVAYALYVWKDIYIVIAIEGLWSLANLVFSTKTARRAYGFFCAAGSVGGIAGNLSIGPLAAAVGTATSLWLAVLLFGLQAAVALALGRAAGSPRPERKARPGLGDSWRVVRNSSYLGWMLLLIASIQVVITLVDYQFNAVIQQAYPDMDRRTAIIGQVYAAIDASSLGLQLATGVLLRAVGLRRVLVGIPVVLGTVLVTFLAMPRFAVMAASKIASKAMDYSLMRASKEMLYIPLSYDEKTRGKALVDMLAYRVAKGGASLLITPLIALAIPLVVVYAAVLFVMAWLALAWRVTGGYQRLIAEREASPTTADDSKPEEQAG
jgi:AAA family ATP:ADP antiporter